MTYITLDINSPTNDRTAHLVELTAYVVPGLTGEPELVDLTVDRISSIYGGWHTPQRHPVALERARETFMESDAWRELVIDAWENAEPDIDPPF